MRNGKIVVLQALGGLKCGGAESRVMDITRRLDNTNIEYDFLLHDKGPDFYEDEASSLGANIYRVPAFRIINYFSYVKALNRLFQEHKEIDIVQGHITSSAAIYLPIAKKHGVKVSCDLNYRAKLWTREEARKDVFKYIELYYNSKRKHSGIGYLSPREFEERNT